MLVPLNNLVTLKSLIRIVLRVKVTDKILKTIFKFHLKYVWLIVTK